MRCASVATPYNKEGDSVKESPHNRQAEAIVLASALMESAYRDTAGEGALDEAISALGTDERVFWVEAHRLIWRAVCQVHASGAPVSPVSVGERLRASGTLDAAGGLASLQRLGHADRANIAYHCEVLLRAAEARALVAVCAEGLEAARTTDDPGAVIASVSTGLDAIADRGTRSSTCEMPDLVDELMADLASTQDDEAPSGWSSGFHDLDNHHGRMAPGRLYLMAGRPGMGKTALALDVALAVVRDELQQQPDAPRPALVFSLEMDARELGWRLVAKEARAPLDCLLNRHKRADLPPHCWSALKGARQFLRAAPLVIDDTPGQTIGRIVGTARALARRRGGLSLVVLDYVQLVTLDARIDEHRGLSDISRRLKLLARELECPVIAVAQLNRDCEKRADKRPVLSDLKGSGGLEQDADSAWFVYRDEYYNEDTETPGVAELLIRKNRQGKTGCVKARWIGDQTRFASLARGE